MFPWVPSAAVLCCIAASLSSLPRVLAVAEEDTSSGNVAVAQDAGEDLFLPCRVTGDVSLYIWEKDDTSVEASDAFRNNRMFVMERKALLILNTVQSDAGVYRCSTVSNRMFNIMTYTVAIRVRDNQDDADIECGFKRDRVESRVVNGRDVNSPGLFPWMALLWHKRLNKPFCGGSLVSHGFVVTAAHCFQRTGFDPDDVEVRLGEHNISSTEAHERTFQIAETIPHPNYDPETFDSDIMLIRLDHRVIYSDYIVPICLPGELNGERLTMARTTGTVAGWGKTSEGSQVDYTNVLKRARLSIRDQTTCGVQHQNYIITQKMFCAIGTGRGGTRDACNGDSGGPFVVKDAHNEERSYLIGVVSWGIGCGRADYPGVYTRVSRFRDWILQHINTDQTCLEKKVITDGDLQLMQSQIDALEDQVDNLERQLGESHSSGPSVCTTPAPVVTTVAPSTEAPFVEEAIECRSGSCWHVGGYLVWATCLNGHCQCDSEHYNPVTCLPSVGSCSIRKNDPNIHAVATTTDGRDANMYSCSGGPGGTEGDVHVLAVHEGNVHTNPPTAANMTVTVQTDRRARPARPVILELSSYEPVNWILDVPDNLVIRKVTLSSYYPGLSSVVVRVNAVVNASVPMAKTPRGRARGFGTDDAGGNTAGMLRRLIQLHGSVASFAGTFRAQSWIWTLPTPPLPAGATEAPSSEEEGGQGNTFIATDRWTLRAFRYDPSWTGCSGEKYVRMRDIGEGERGKYIGAILCAGTNERYKLFMADDLREQFRNIADSSGHGSDHCQFVSAADDTDFNSDDTYWHAPTAEGYYRNGWGEEMTFGTIGGGLGTQWTGRYYPKWYECGVSIP